MGNKKRYNKKFKGKRVEERQGNRVFDVEHFSPAPSTPGTAGSVGQTKKAPISSNEEGSIAASIEQQVADMEQELEHASILDEDSNQLALLSDKLGINKTAQTLLLSMGLETIEAFINLDCMPMEELLQFFPRRDLRKESFQDVVLYGLCLGSSFHTFLRQQSHVGHQEQLPRRDIPSTLEDTETFLHSVDVNTIVRLYKQCYWRMRTQWLNFLDDNLPTDSGGSILGSYIGGKPRELIGSPSSHQSKGGSRYSAYSKKSKVSKHSQSSKKSKPPPRVATGEGDDVSVLSELSEAKSNLTHAFVKYGERRGSRNKDDFEPDTASKFVRTFKKNNTPVPTTKDEKRQVLPARVIWEGDLSLFEDFRNRVEGHYAQTGAGYLFSEDFQSAYLKDGSSCYVDFIDEVHSESQVKKDVKALYGALTCACQAGVGRTVLLEYRKTQDGLRAWHKLVKKYEADGNKNIRIKKLEEIISINFHRRYKGGLTKWIQDYENAFSELVTLDQDAWMSDDAKKRRIIQNAQHIGLSTTLLEEIALKKSFEEVCNLLRSHAISQDQLHRENAASKVHATKSEDLLQQLVGMVNNLQTLPNSDKDGSESTIEVLAQKISQMPLDMWRKLPREVQQWILQERKRLNEDEKKGTMDSNDISHDKKPPLPSQYSKANQVATSDDPENIVDEFLKQDIEEDSEDDVLLSTCSVARTTCHVSIHRERARQCMTMLNLPEHSFLSITDNGADTCVIGKGWEILTSDPNRKANVVGFDKKHAVKRNLSIVGAVTAVDLSDGSTILLRVSEAIHNPSEEHSLLSEFQMREFGTIVDSIARRHGGKQQISVSDSDGQTIDVPLALSQCLLHFKHRVPTKHEMAELEVVPITQDGVPWKPHKYNDDPADAFGKEVAHLEEENEAEYAVQRSQCSHSFGTNTEIDSAGDALVPEGVFLEENSLKYYDPSDEIYEPVSLGEFVCLNVDVEQCLSLSDDDVDNSFSPDIIPSTPDPTVSKFSRAIPKKVDIEKLAPYFAFRPADVIRNTLRKTTQLATSVVHFPLRRHLKSRFQMLRKRRLNEVIATDTYFSSVKSLEGYWCAQVFYGTKSHRIHIEGMKSESQFPDAYLDFIRKHGIPPVLHKDNAKSEMSDKVKQIHRDLIIADTWTEPHSPWQNPAELNGVKVLKSHAQVLMDRQNAPPETWFLAQSYLADIHNVCAHPLLQWNTPDQVAGGDTPDISHILMFYWFEPVLYLDPTASFPESKEKPGYFVGFAHNVGDFLTFKILKEDMKTVIHRSVVRSARDPQTRNKRVSFVDEIEKELDKADKGTLLKHEEMNSSKDQLGDLDDNEAKDAVSTRTRSKHRINGSFRASDSNGSVIPSWLVALLSIPTILLFSTFQIVNYMGSQAFFDPICPLVVDTLGMKERKLYRQTITGLGCNDVSKLQYVQACDSIADGDDPDNELWNCSRVVEHRIKKGTTVQVKCQWKDPNKSLTWVDMSALALQDPVPILRYAKTKHLLSDIHFRHLVNYCTGEAPSNLARAFKAKIMPGTPKYKFGVQVPVGLKQAFALDKRNGNNDWENAIKKELKQLFDYNTFKKLKPGEVLPTEYKKIPYHIIFDVKFDLRRKARLVAGGNWTDVGKDDVYSGVVGIESVRTGFFLGELNGLTCCAADVGNAFLYGKTREKVYIIAGREFGKELEGCVLIVYKALYGLRTSAARFHEHLACTLRNLGFKQSKYDMDLWYIDKGSHYEYIATFVDDLLVWSKDPMAIMKELEKIYILKGVGVPEYYLGGDVEMLDEHWNSDHVCLALSAGTYIKNLIPKFERLFGVEAFKTYKTPMEEGLHPELDDSPFCSDDDAAKFRSIIGSLNWIITLGRFDVSYATSSLSRFGMAPREGHLKAALRILGYLKAFSKGRVIYGVNYPDHSKYPVEDHPNWTEFYPDAEEEVPPDMPLPKGKPVRITVYVDADHAHDQVTRRSVTGIVLFLNNTPIRVVCKRQKTVETSTYGSELVAARVATELVMEMRYMLRMLGVPLDGPALMLGDNMSVVLNTTLPSSVLKKKHCAISYHRVREAIAAKILRFAHVPSPENIADIATKPLGNAAFHALIKNYLFRTPKTLKKAQGN